MIVQKYHFFPFIPNNEQYNRIICNEFQVKVVFLHQIQARDASFSNAEVKRKQHFMCGL